MYFDCFSKAASYSLDLWYCTVNCLIFFSPAQQSMYVSENMKCSDSCIEETT